MDEAKLHFVHRDKARNNGLKLEQRKSHTTTQKNFFVVRLPREVVELPSMEIFKCHLDAYLCDLL